MVSNSISTNDHTSLNTASNTKSTISLPTQHCFSPTQPKFCHRRPTQPKYHPSWKDLSYRATSDDGRSVDITIVRPALTDTKDFGEECLCYHYTPVSSQQLPHSHPFITNIIDPHNPFLPNLSRLLPKSPPWIVSWSHQLFLESSLACRATRGDASVSVERPHPHHK